MTPSGRGETALWVVVRALHYQKAKATDKADNGRNQRGARGMNTYQIVGYRHLSKVHVDSINPSRVAAPSSLCGKVQAQEWAANLVEQSELTAINGVCRTCRRLALQQG